MSDFSLTFPNSRNVGAWLHRSHPERPDEAATVQLDRGLSSQPHLLTVPFDRDCHHNSDHNSDHNFDEARFKRQDSIAQVLIFSLVPETLIVTLDSTHITPMTLI